MESSAAGIVAIAVGILVFGYWLPSRARHRAELAQAHTADRFSPGLRVLNKKTAARRHPTPGCTPAVTLHPDTGGIRMVTARPDKSNTARTPDSPPAARAGRASRTGSANRAGSEGRADQAARDTYLAARAKRAHRRLALTVTLLAATAATAAAAAWTTLLWYSVLAPVALLALVLLLGRQAAKAGQRADARWNAQPAGQEANACREVSRPAPQHQPRPRNADVTYTQARKTRPAVADDARQEDARPAAAGHDKPAPTSRPGVSHGGTPLPAEAAQAATELIPRPQARYAAQPVAPYEAPRPITGENTLAPEGISAQGTSVQGTSARETSARGIWGVLDDDPQTRPHTDSLSLPLNQILARRRTAS